MGEGQSEPSVENGKKKRRFWSVVLVIALIVFVCAMAALALIAFSYCQGQQKYEDVAREMGLDALSADSDEADLDALTIDWDALRAANPEVVGWVFIPGTSINYPIVQGEDNDKYLSVDFDGDAGWLANYGAIFLDYRNAPNFSDNANFIYGHNMNDGSMFSELTGFADQARFDGCRTVYLLTPSGNYRLRTFALLHIDAYDPLVQTKFANRKEYWEYLQDKLDRSVVDGGDVPGVHDIGRVFAFATCDDWGSGRYVLYAYIEDREASGLTGDLGIAQDDGQTVGFEDGLSADAEG